jgi:L,D-peptidoglycan transpeptidase YkuD (ErfK/YbiS/YcfS/YnhG family)
MKRAIAFAGVSVLLVAGIMALAVRRADATTPPPPALVRQPIGDATQVLLVRAPSARSTTAVLEGWQLDAGTWHRVLGPYTARIGRSGLSTTHHEGDGSSPAGVFTLTQAFGLLSDPGSQLPYRQAGPNDWWVSDASSPFYNTWQVGPPNGRWNPAAGEQLAVRGRIAYGYAVVVDYNRAPVVPGAGSAIFVHIGSTPTSGCVAISRAGMVQLLRWLDPARHPAIAMGADAWLLSTGTIASSVRFGQRGEAVRVVQRALAQRGLLAAVDGTFGPVTRAAVRSFQRTRGLAVNGVVNAATATALGIWAP